MALRLFATLSRKHNHFSFLLFQILKIRLKPKQLLTNYNNNIINKQANVILYHLLTLMVINPVCSILMEMLPGLPVSVTHYM